MSIKYKKEFHNAYDELVLIMDDIENMIDDIENMIDDIENMIDDIENMIEKPENKFLVQSVNEYDKGFNRACKVILEDLLGPFNYRMEVRLKNELEWLDND